MIAGTVRYMAPEQFQGENSTASDIYSLALVVCEMLTGIPDFRGRLTEDRRLATLLEAALARDPNARPPDVRTWCTELSNALIHRRGQVWPARVSARSRVWMFAFAALVLVAGTYSYLFRVTPEARWSATRLGGANVALAPRVSPDGRLVAFIAMVDGMTQVAVMKQESGNWTTLTHDRSRGNVGEIAWSPDGTRLYFDRSDDVARGVFSVPVLGGDERLVMDDASTPEVLADGSLVAVRINAERNAQPHRFWPESGRVQPLNAVLSTTLQNSVMMRATGRAEKLVFWGRPLAGANAREHLYIMDLDSQAVRQLAPGLTFPPNLRYLPFAVSPDGRVAYFDAPSGDLHRIVSVPTDGSNRLQTLFSVPTTIAYIDVDSDGSVYVDQWERPFDVIRFAPRGGKPEYIATATGHTLGVVPLPDGRVVYESHEADRRRLLVGTAGRPAVPLVETQEETRLPLTPVDGNRVAFIIGSGDARTIGLASVTDGRVVRRLAGSKGTGITSMAASLGGGTIYYSSSGSIWRISVEDGAPVMVRSGDAVTIDPYRNELIVSLFEKQGVRLVVVPLNGSPERPIRVAGAIGLAPSPLSPAAVKADGRILVRAVPPGSWFYPTGLLDAATGRIELVSIGYDADMGLAGWTTDGSVVAVAAPLRSSLWMFRPPKAVN
jgi:Tol biopolymer transport system component